MQAESLVQLIGSGNTSTVEAEWARLLESSEVTPAALRGYQPVLAELCKVGKTPLAEEWAWTAIESMSTRLSPAETLELAGAFLLAIGDSKELRHQVAELYRAAHGEREGLEALLTEAGLGGGRPVRRALRTLDVCLSLENGDFLLSREPHGAARVVAVDRTTWRISIDTGTDQETLGAVELADQFRRAAADEFGVLRCFAPDRLSERLAKDPAGILAELCQSHNGSLSSSDLEALLVPDPYSDSQFKSWWTKARTALKKCSNVKLEGRSPYTLTYVDTPVAHDEILLAGFERLHDPAEQLDRVEKFIRDCKDRGEVPSAAALKRCYDSACREAKELSSKGSSLAGLAWAAAGRIGESAGAGTPWAGLVELFRKSPDVKPLLIEFVEDSLFDRTVSAMGEAHPKKWRDFLIDALPSLRANLCDRAASHLVDAGWTPEEFDVQVQRVLSAPAAHFEALLWLWDGPSKKELDERVNGLTVLTRILRTLDEFRRGETIGKERAKVLASRSRTVLSARRYERFVRCLEGLDPGMAGPLKTQIAVLDNLGRAVPEDLTDLLRRQFPTKDTTIQTPRWKRDDALYVTREALKRKQEEIEQHVNVKMRDNARAIGAAAERGDLSENSEYKFALEERDLLRARLAQMNSEMAKALVMTSGDVPADEIGIGTRVVFEHVDDGGVVEMTFLGPWDADHARARYNYQAPLAQTLMGKHIGDTVQFDHDGAQGTYRVAALHNALTHVPAPTEG